MGSFQNVFSAFTVLWVLMALVVMAGFVAVLVFVIRRISHETHKNDGKPVESVRARVVSKRTDVQAMSNSPVYTHYFATFELTDGSRVEVQLAGEQFGLLAEGDEGVLTHRGTKFYSFVR